MRRILGVLTTMGVLACSGGGDKVTGPSAPTTGSIVFKLDANSCTPIFGTNTLTFTFFIDGSSVGSAAIGINQQSPSYTVSPGTHVASASVTNSTLRWQNLSATVSAGQTFAYVLSC